MINDSVSGELVVVSQRAPQRAQKQHQNLAEMIMERGLSHELPVQGLTKELQEKVIKHHQKEAWREGWHKKGANWLARIQFYLLQVGCALRNLYNAHADKPISQAEFSLTIEQAKACLPAADGNAEEVEFLTNYIVMKNSQAFIDAADRGDFTAENLREDAQPFIAFKREGLNESALGRWQQISNEGQVKPEADFRATEQRLQTAIATLNRAVSAKKDEVEQLRKLMKELARVKGEVESIDNDPQFARIRGSEAVNRKRQKVQALSAAVQQRKSVRELRDEQAEASATVVEIAPLLSEYVTDFVKLQKIQGRSDEEIKSSLLDKATELGKSGDMGWQGDKPLTTLMNEAIIRIMGY